MTMPSSTSQSVLTEPLGSMTGSFGPWMHEVAFKIAGSMAVQEACRMARPVILEPVMRVEVVTPEQFMGDVTGSLNSKRGQIEAMEDRGMNKVIRAKVPLSEMFGYTTTLRSMTEGRGSMTMEFDHYEEVPRSMAEEVIKKVKGQKANA